MAKNLRDITVDEDMGIVMSDGCRLSARVWMPEDAVSDPVPVILEYLPYRKRDGTTARDALTHPYFAKRGYACLRVDMRGNGDSQGVMQDEYTQQELDDAVEIINWAAAQSWCSGTVGMMGISWGGFNALQVAALQPEPLKAIITLCSTADRYADDIHYKGGCLLNENLGWGSTMWAYSSRPPDPMLVGDAWREMWLERLQAEPFLPELWLRHQRRDEYWKHGSICEDFSAVKAATLAIGGWGDAYKNTVPNLVENLTCPVKGIVGPWVHKYPHFAVPEPRIGFLQEALRWWDKWLKDISTGVDLDPAYTTYAMDGVRPQTWYAERSGTWITSDTVDAPETTVFYLADDKKLSQTSGTINDCVSSPMTAGLSAGEYCAIWLGPEMPGDQRQDDSLGASYVSAPLEDGLNITGAPEILIKLLCDKPQGQIAVRLGHVHADGATTRITYGVLNLAHRASHQDPTQLPQGTPTDVKILLDHVAYKVPKGDRISITVSDAYWPLIWPSPERTTLTLLEGTLRVPNRPMIDQDERIFPEPDAEEPWDINVFRPANNIRETHTDLKTGVVTLHIEDDFGVVQDADHGLVSGSIAREWWRIHPDDPSSAQGETHWTEERSRDDWITRTESFAKMSCDSTTFYLWARLEAYEGDILIFEKEHTYSIPRDHM